jgi:putative transposase
MTNRKHLNHETPHWVTPDANYFVTLCAEPRNQNHFCHPTVGTTVLDSICFYHKKQTWFCHLAVLMPDHIHFIVCFPPDQILSQAIGLWRRGLARNHAIPWQRNFFEHRLRDDEALRQKADYILHNPVRAGLVEQPQDWPYTWMPNGEPTAARDSGGYHEGSYSSQKNS